MTVMDAPITTIDDIPIVTFPDPLGGPDVFVVERARNHLSDPHRWCIGTLGRDEYGEPCDPFKANSVCAMGALYVFGLPTRLTAATDTDSIRTITGWGKYVVEMLAYYSSKLYGRQTIVQVNDGEGYDEVLSVYDAYLDYRKDHPLGTHPEDFREYTDAYPSMLFDTNTPPF